MSTLADIAAQFIGFPYILGATGPTSFDCSGLVQFCAAQLGVSVPHFTDDQAAALAADGSLNVGDVLYYHWDDPSQPGVYYPHCEIYAGDGQVVGARSPATGVVRAAPLDHPYVIRTIGPASGGGDPLPLPDLNPAGALDWLKEHWKVAVPVAGLVAWALDLL